MREPLSSRWKLAILIVCVLLIPIVPFLVFANQLEPWAQKLIEADWLVENPVKFSFLVIGLLIVDLLMPIPSSVVCTVAGGVLGSIPAVFVCWLGLNLSALLGYVLSSWFGPRTIERFSSVEQISATVAWVDRFGPWGLVVCRSLPVLAEASVFFVGLHSMKPKRFWPPVICANMAIAIAYCTMGGFAAQQGWFVPAVTISIAVPVTAMLMWAWTNRGKQFAETNPAEPK